MAAIAGLLMLLAALGAPLPSGDKFGRAVQQWHTRGFESYRISVMMDYRGEVCFQELEVHGTQDPRLLRGTCPHSWLGYLTVPRLFDITDEIASIPDARCYPSSRNCVCRRSFSKRVFGFDEQLGYPTTLSTYSELHESWDRPEFWMQLLATRDIPRCMASPRRLVIQIVSLTPLPS